MTASEATSSEPPKVSFNSDIRPILSDNCYACHGPDKNKREAGLRLDRPDGASAELESGAIAIVPGDVAKSELVRRITSSDEYERMPPPEHPKRLTPKQISLLTAWVAQGAEYEPHWAFVPTSRPDVPAVDSPAILRNPIDHFIVAKLRAEGLVPSDEADKRTLIRRVTLDLHGLPPTPEEVEAFVADTSPDAYEKLVDRLLASPRFAERQAMFWLDAVRYADCVGFHGDQFVSVWPYRDYVLKAFDANMPFDQFLREQLAGDLLPNATREQRIASCFNRLNRMTAEGGAQDKEYLAKYAADRVRTIGTAFLGLTTGCAECHDHKFDPLTTRNFYQLEAFFADIEEKGFYGGANGSGKWGPEISLLSSEQDSQLAALDAQLKEVRDAQAAITNDQLATGRAEWEAHTLALDAAKQLAWHTVEPTSLTTEHGATLTHAGGGLIVAGGPNPDNETYTVTFKPGEGRWTSLMIQPEGAGDLPGNGIARGWVSFLLTEIEAEASVLGASEPVLRDEGSGETEDSETVSPSPASPDPPLPVAQTSQLTFSEVLTDGLGDVDPYPPGATFDGDPKTGWGNENGSIGGKRLVLRFKEPLEATADTTVTVSLRHDSALRKATIGKFRVRLSRVEGATVDENGLPEKVLAALRVPSGMRNPAHTEQLVTFYRTAAPELAELRQKEDRLVTERAIVAASVPTVLVTQARNEPRPIRVLPRGNWMDDSGDIVEPNVPEFLGALELDERRATRLDLANWIASESNPLTARVFVNRQWKQFFGTGLSKVLEDVGAQGEWPSHPGLLDWLACEFMQPSINADGTHTWDVKHLVRTIVTSHTYRQASIADFELPISESGNAKSGFYAREGEAPAKPPLRTANESTLAAQQELRPPVQPSALAAASTSQSQIPNPQTLDPDNRLLARQNPIRLDAEQVRDSALAISGLLAHRFGGPSVFPVQPDGYWSALNFPKREYSASRGDDLHRRSVYTHWQRTFLHPSLVVFDAASREECTVNRTNSNTPLQALVLLNDPIFVEAARVFAQHAMTEGGSTPADNITWAFRRAVSRSPGADEHTLLMDLYAKQQAHFRADASAAEALLAVGEAPLDPSLDRSELAAMTTVTRTILNLHEVVTRD